MRLLSGVVERPDVEGPGAVVEHARDPVPADKAFKDGWVRRDGRTIRLLHASKRVDREPGTLRPTHIAIEMHDAEGGVHEVTGQIVAGLPWGGWHNMNCHLGLVRWELDGHVG